MNELKSQPENGLNKIKEEAGRVCEVYTRGEKDKKSWWFYN